MATYYIYDNDNKIRVDLHHHYGNLLYDNDNKIRVDLFIIHLFIIGNMYRDYMVSIEIG